MKDLLLILLASGGVLVTITTLICDIVLYKIKRKDAQKDKQDKQQEEKEKQLYEEIKLANSRYVELKEEGRHRTDALKFLLYDKIRTLALNYLNDGSIDLDDRRIINAMHSTYHNGLYGNGDLDALMKQVNSLPIIDK